MRTTAAVLFAALLAPLTPAAAQDASPERSVYRVDITIRDSSGTAKPATRRYSILIRQNSAGTFKLGDRVPVATGSFQPGVGGVGVNPMVNTQYTYLDTGVNIEAHLHDDPSGRVELQANIDISSIATHQPAGAAPAPNPTVSQSRIVANATLPVGKPTLVASVDDPASNHKLDIEATITRAN